MSDNTSPIARPLHPDFPTEILGAVAGAQMKLTLCRNNDGRYVSPRRSPEEVQHRFEIADTLVDSLVADFKRKKVRFPEWSDEFNLERIRSHLDKKAENGDWAFTEAERTWIMARLRERI